MSRVGQGKLTKRQFRHSLKRIRYNLLDKQFGRLTVTAFAGRRYRGKSKSKFDAMWECRCQCGNTSTVKGSALRHGATSSCGCAGREITQRRTLLPDGEAIKRAAWRAVTYGAKRRGITVTIPEGVFREIVEMPCTYCGARASQRRKRQLRNAPLQDGVWETNTIDRIDNNLGYIPGNVASACYTCNMAKGTLSVAEFKLWLTNAYRCFVDTEEAS
jgi:hypothetical protein